MMRRSFPVRRGNAGASGGGFGGAGGVFRRIIRVSKAGISNLQDPSSPSSKKASKHHLSLNSLATAVSAIAPSNSNLGLDWPLNSSSCFNDESDWEVITDECATETELESIDDCVFGSVPSPIEAETALVSLHHTFPKARDSDLDWIEPPSTMYQFGCEQNVCPDGVARVYDAFHLLQTEPSVKRMVISLSSDRAVWNAVLNNEVVREIREAFCKANEVNVLESSGNEPDPPTPPTNVVSWIFNNMRDKFMEFLSGITNLMKEMFQPPSHDQQQTEEFPEGFGEVVRAAFMLTAIVLLVVVVTRATHA